MMSFTFDDRHAMKAKCEDVDIGIDERPGAAMKGISVNTQEEKRVISTLRTWGVTGTIRRERRRAKIQRIVEPM